MKQEEVIKRIRVAFDESGLTIDQLAERLDVSNSTASRYVSGGINLSIHTASKLADALGVSLGKILTFDDENTEDTKDLVKFMKSEGVQAFKFGKLEVQFSSHALMPMEDLQQFQKTTQLPSASQLPDDELQYWSGDD